MQELLIGGTQELVFNLRRLSALTDIFSGFAVTTCHVFWCLVCIHFRQPLAFHCMLKTRDFSGFESDKLIDGQPLHFTILGFLVMLAARLRGWQSCSFSWNTKGWNARKIFPLVPAVLCAGASLPIQKLDCYHPSSSST